MIKIKRERNEEIIKKFNSGCTVTSLAREYKISRQAIYNILNRGLIGGKKYGLTDFQKKKINEIPYNSIRNYLLENKITVREFLSMISENEKKAVIIRRNLISGSIVKRTYKNEVEKICDIVGINKDELITEQCDLALK